jgi:hypothetical protein
MRMTKSHSGRDVQIPKIVEEPATAIVTIPVTDADYAALEAMARATGQSIVNVIRLALWHYAHHLDLDPPAAIFGVRRSSPQHH